MRVLKSPQNWQFEKSELKYFNWKPDYLKTYKDISMPKSYSIITYDEKKVLTKEQIQKVKGHIDENK